MTLWCGIDLHANNSYVTIIDDEDRIVFEKRLPNELLSIVTALSPYREAIDKVAVESTFNWYWLVDGLMATGYDVRLVHTAAVKVYEGKKRSGDAHDARHLAHLLRLRLLPEGYIYPKDQRPVRDLLRKRGQLVRQRTANILSMENLLCRDTGQNFNSNDIKRLTEADIDAHGGDPRLALALKSNWVVLQCLDAQIDEIEKAVLKQARLRPEYRALTTAPGIGVVLGLTIALETGDVHRFAKVGNFSSYSRCVDSRRESNGKKKGEGNVKNGNRYLAWAFIEAAHFAVRYNEDIKRFFQRKKAKTNAMVAIKATAHKMARACYFVMRDRVEFDVKKAFA